MWNGNAVPAGRFLLAAFIFLGGCDGGPAPRQEAATYESQVPNARYRIDPERSRVWLLAREAVYLYDFSRPERTAVSLPGWITVDSPYSCLPDLALGPKGEVIVTSNVLPTLWRIDPATLAVSVHPLVLDADNDKDVGFSGLVYSAQHRAFIAVSYAHGSLWKIDPRLERAQKIPVSAPLREACGLAVQPRSLQPVFDRPSDFCVHTPHGGLSVVFAPANRSAHVSAAPCAERPAPFNVARFDHPVTGN